MPRYEPMRNDLPLVQAGGTLKMRRTADGKWEPVPAAASPRDGAAEPDPADQPPDADVPGADPGGR